MRRELTRIYKGPYGWTGDTMFTDINGYDWDITTMKRSNGLVTSVAKAGTFSDGERFTGFAYAPFTDPSITLLTEKATATESIIKAMHYKALALFDQKLENDELPVRKVTQEQGGVKRGTIFYLDNVRHDEKRDLVAYEVKKGPWGVQVSYIDIENLTMGVASKVEPEADRFGIGYYYDPALPPMPEDELNNLLLDALAKKKKDEAAAARRKDEADRVRREKIEKGKAIVKVPSWAEAVVLAQLWVTDRDPYADYSNSYAEEGKSVYLAWSRTARNNMQELRKAASKFPETEMFGPGYGIYKPYVIHADTYRKGQRSEWHREMHQDDKRDQLEFRTMAEAQQHIDKQGKPRDINAEEGVMTFDWYIDEVNIERTNDYRPSYYLGEPYGDGWKVVKQRFDAKNERDLENLYIAAAEGRYLANVAEPSAPKQTAVAITGTSGIAMEMVKTVHTQKGFDLWVVKLADRVDKDTYTALNAEAKRLGGWYSSFRGAGAVPGFQFKSEDAARQFMGQGAATVPEDETIAIRARAAATALKLKLKLMQMKY